MLQFFIKFHFHKFKNLQYEKQLLELSKIQLSAFIELLVKQDSYTFIFLFMETMKRAKASPKGANENVLQVLTVDLNRLYSYMRSPLQ